MMLPVMSLAARKLPIAEPLSGPTKYGFQLWLEPMINNTNEATETTAHRDNCRLATPFICHEALHQNTALPDGSCGLLLSAGFLFGTGIKSAIRAN